jgi:hypothetical protein
VKPHPVWILRPEARPRPLRRNPMLAFEGDSHVEWFEGNFAASEEDKKGRLGIDRVIPNRMKYKRFSG